MAPTYQEPLTQPARHIASDVSSLPADQRPGPTSLAVQAAGDGLLQSTVHEPFMLVVRTAHGLGLETGMGPDVHEKQVQSEGLLHIEAVLAGLKKGIRALPAHGAAHLSLLDHLVQIQAAIAKARGEQDEPSNYRGIERRSTQPPVAPNPP